MLTSLRDRGPYKGWALRLQGTLQKWGVLARKATSAGGPASLPGHRPYPEGQQAP